METILSEYVAQWGNVSAAKPTLVLKPPPRMVTFEQPQYFGDSSVRIMPNRLAADERAALLAWQMQP
jgi:hypothetical protein